MISLQAMVHTPLQNLLEIGGLGAPVTEVAEGTIALAALLCAFALRKRSWLVNTGSLILLAISMGLDILAIRYGVATKWLGAFALIFFYWALVRVVVDLIFRPRRGIHYSAIPHDAAMILLGLLVLAVVFYADLDFDPMKLFASGALVSGAIVFALQEPLRNLATGLTFHITKPFQPGDWVNFQNHLGEVKATTWVSTEIVTRTNERVQIPNVMLVTQPVKNFRNTAIADEIAIGISYDDPPGRVKETILRVVRDIPHVLGDPPPQVFAWEYGDYAIKYRVRYYLADYVVQETVRDTLVSSLWYALRRHAIDIPYPTQTLQMRPNQREQRQDAEYEKQIIADLRRVDFLRELNDEEMRLLLPTVSVHQFGGGELIVRQGDPADSFFVIRSGTVAISARAKDGSVRELATNSSASRHPFFGETAMMSGEARNASIRATTDVEVLVMSREGFVQLFKAHPELAETMGGIIAERESENRQLLANAPDSDGARGFKKRFVEKMRVIFDL